jgi:hypothetical protein
MFEEWWTQCELTVTFKILKRHFCPSITLGAYGDQVVKNSPEKHLAYHGGSITSNSILVVISSVPESILLNSWYENIGSWACGLEVIIVCVCVCVYLCVCCGEQMEVS